MGMTSIKLIAHALTHEGGRYGSGRRRCFPCGQDPMRGILGLLLMFFPATLLSAVEFTNPVSGEPERFYVERIGSTVQVLWTHKVNGVWQQASVLTTSGADHAGATGCFDPDSGNSVIVFWRDSTIPAVYYRERDHSSGVWNSEQLVSNATQDVRFPSCIILEEELLIVAEARATDNTRSAVAYTVDHDLCPGPNCPIGYQLLSSTALTSSINPIVHSASGIAWADWIDATGYMAFSVYSESTGWSAPEQRAIVVDVPTTRAEIEAEVVP